MFHLVTGGSGSGKSAFAEDMICGYAAESAGDLFYIATMMPFGEETKQKINRHRRMRADKGFQTIECYTGLERIAEQGSECCPGWENAKRRCVLLECMSNLAANEIYQPASEVHEPANEAGQTDRAGAEETLAEEAVTEETAEDTLTERILHGVMALKERCSHLVIVTNEVCSECAEDSEEMQMYKRILAAVNVRLAQMADAVTEVVYGIPVPLKRPVAAEPDELAGIEKVRGSDKTECLDKVEDREKTKDIWNGEGEPHMKLVIGGAHQGKSEYAKRKYGRMHPDASDDAKEHFVWADGEHCSFEELYSCDGIDHFELLLKRMMRAGEDLSNLPSQITEKNPDLVIVTTEIGYGLVPIEAFDREYREQTGRICTQLARLSSRVDRVVCGIGVTLKGE